MTATTHSDSAAPATAASSAEAKDEDATGSGPRPSFTITEAASACAVSRKTITRKLAELGEAGAAKDPDGIWRIPVEALLSVGLHPGRSLNPGTARREPVVDLRSTRQAPTEQPQAPETITVPRDRWDDLRIRLARAEAESTERGRALEDARLALRALTAGPAAMPGAAGDAAVNGAATHWEPTTSAIPRNEQVGPARGFGDSSSHEVPGPVPGLPPTPVPRSLAADSAVWDTLLPRAATAATATTPVPSASGTVATSSSEPSLAATVPTGSVAVETMGGGQPGVSHAGSAHEPGAYQPGAYQPGSSQPEQQLARAEPPAPGQVVAPRRRWWGGKR